MNARVAKIDSMSAHADSKEILRWLRGFTAPPKRTFLVHGEPVAMQALQATITSELGWNVHMPQPGKRGWTYNSWMDSRDVAELKTTDRKYLLERVDEAAVAQVYADGFDELPLDQKILIWHLYRAALAGRDIYLRPALRAQPRDARRARGDHHPRRTASTPATLAEIQRYTKLFWINAGPYNNLTARKFVLKCTPEAFAAAAAQAPGTARAADWRGESLAQLSSGCAPMFFDLAVDPIVTNKTPGRGQGHPRVERQQLLRRRHDGGSRGIRGEATR